jgi:hypothetical protein
MITYCVASLLWRSISLTLNISQLHAIWKKIKHKTCEIIQKKRIVQSNNKQQKTNWLEIKGCLPFNIICITVSDCKENWFQDTSKLTQDHRLPWHICQIDRSIKWYKWTFVLPWKVPMLPICKCMEYHYKTGYDNLLRCFFALEIH